jgi:hypothetical protein
LSTVAINTLIDLHQRLKSAAATFTDIAREIGDCCLPEPLPPSLPYSGAAPANADVVHVADELLMRWARQMDRGLRDAVAVRRTLAPIAPTDLPEMAELNAWPPPPDMGRQRR